MWPVSNSGVLPSTPMFHRQNPHSEARPSNFGQSMSSPCSRSALIGCALVPPRHFGGALQSTTPNPNSLCAPFPPLFVRRKVRVSGLKLLLGVVAAGASPSAASGGGSNVPIPEPPEPLISDLRPGRTGDTTIRVNGAEGKTARGGGGSEPRVLELRARQHVGHGGDRAGAGAGAAGILSPAVVSRAKRMLVGISNIDESADARRLAAQALAALGSSSNP